MHEEKHLACLSLNGNLGCSACAEPYILKVDGTDSKNTCVWKTAYCIEYNAAAVCTRCEHTHYLSTTNTCIPKIHGCKTMIEKADSAEYDMLRPRCKTCLTDWHILDG